MIRVLIADDHAFFRQCLGGALSSCQDISFVGECADGDEVVDAVARTSPHVVVMDLRMPRMSGIEATKAIKAGAPSVEVLMLSSVTTSHAISSAAAAGAAGYLVKGGAFATVVDAVRSIASGGTAWPFEPPVAAAGA